MGLYCEDERDEMVDVFESRSKSVSSDRCALFNCGDDAESESAEGYVFKPAFKSGFDWVRLGSSSNSTLGETDIYTKYARLHNQPS